MVLQKPTPTVGKHFAPGASVNARDEHGKETPTFCFHYVDPDYCITRCEKDDIVAYADHLRMFSQLTWNDIIQADRHKLGREKITRTAIKRPIPKHLTDDVKFIALRFSGKKPMVGYQSGRTFHAIWFDRNMKGVYNHG